MNDLIFENYQHTFDEKSGLIALDSSVAFSKYKKMVKSIPDLTIEEEIAALQDFKNHNRLESVQKVILSNLKHVLYVVKQYKGYGLPEQDLVQEGNIGLMKAVKNYLYDFKVRIISYALSWIKAEIQSYILKNWKIVKIATTNELKKLFFNLRKTQKEIESLGLNESQFYDMVSKKLHVTKENIKEMMSYFGHHDVMIDEKNELFIEHHELIEFQDPEMFYVQKQTNQMIEKIKNLLETDFFQEKEKVVLMKKYLVEEPLSNKDIGKILNISAERVRQIEDIVIHKIQKKLKTI